MGGSPTLGETLRTAARLLLHMQAGIRRRSPVSACLRSPSSLSRSAARPGCCAVRILMLTGQRVEGIARLHVDQWDAAEEIID
jgi:hypothetical protein